jgi:hypothetical protein
MKRPHKKPARNERVPVPKNIQRGVLFRNQSVCCVCQKLGVQLHHIDGDPSNNRPSNLCVLCIEHHAEASSTSTMVKALSPSLLRQYKKAWEARVTIKYQIESAKRVERPSRAERREIAMDIKKTLFGLIGSKSSKQINESIDYLYGWCLIEVGPKDILRTLHSMHWLLEIPTIVILVRRLHEFFGGFVGPGYVSISSSDERQLISAIKLLGIIALQGVLFEADSSFFTPLARAFKQFSQIGLDYRRKAIGKAIMAEIDEVRAELEKTTYPRRIRLGVKRLESAFEIAKSALMPGPRRVGFEVLLKKKSRVSDHR